MSQPSVVSATSRRRLVVPAAYWSAGSYLNGASAADVVDHPYVIRCQNPNVASPAARLNATTSSTQSADSVAARANADGQKRV